MKRHRLSTEMANGSGSKPDVRGFDSLLGLNDERPTTNTSRRTEMRLTGYQLMDRLEELKGQAKTLDGQFGGALYRFESEEEKGDPRQIMAAYAECERKITLIQEAQARYNLAVAVTVDGDEMTLHRAVRQGGLRFMRS